MNRLILTFSIILSIQSVYAQTLMRFDMQSPTMTRDSVYDYVKIDLAFLQLQLRILFYTIWSPRLLYLNRNNSYTNLIMMESKIKSYPSNIFESLHFIKTIPYEVFWTLFACISFLTGELLILYFKEEHFLVVQIFFCGMVGALPILYKLYYTTFWSVTEQLKILFDIKEMVWEQWLVGEADKIFSFKSKISKFILILSNILVFSTLSFIGVPFDSLPLIIFSLVGMFILTSFCSIILQFSIMLLLFLRKLTLFKTIAKFYLFPHPELTKLNRYFSSLSITISLGYIAIVFSVWFSPYGFNFQMLIWLSVLALYPITLFV